MRYENLFVRLLANTHEPENYNQCWLWRSKCDDWGYGQINVYVPMVGGNVTMKAHIAQWCWIEADCFNANDLYLAYQELQASGLELDHTCVTRHCINIDHIDLVTSAENSQRRNQRIAAMLAQSSALLEQTYA